MDNKLRSFSRKKAIEITGGLSYPSKMSCPAWGIPTDYCITGAKLAKIEGSVCSKCYAERGPISWPRAKASQQRRYEAINHPHWVNAMVDLIAMECDSYFRWFDVGDIQSLLQLRQIVDIAIQLPHIQFWLSTHETKLVNQLTYVPGNLCIRLSAPMLDGPASNYKNTSTVKTATKSEWVELVCNDPSHCPAPLQDNKCGSCRKCWDKIIKNIVYRKH